MTATARATAAAAAAQQRRHQRTAFAVVIVLLAIAIATAVLLSLQATAFRQAVAGRRAVAEVRAKWAARAGIEASIARLARNVESRDEGSAYTALDDLVEVSVGNLDGARWTIEHWDGEVLRPGPADPHSKLNVNIMTAEDLAELEGLTEDIASAIRDWVDQDDEVSEVGAEEGAYRGFNPPRTPRNRPVRSLGELELILGVDPELLRGEDWNLNGRLDPNEDDGDATWPPDNSDGILDAGWSAIITTESVDEGLAFSGEPRLFLGDADQRQLSSRIDGLSPLQAGAIIEFARRADQPALGTFISTPLPQLAASLGTFSQSEIQAIQPLEADQLTELIDETTLADPEDGPLPGKLNLNLVRREVLDYISIFRGTGAGLADQLIFWRDSRPQGFVHITDLLEYTSPQNVDQLSRIFDVTSNAWVVTSRGRDIASGVEVEIQATIERTALPIVISELRMR